MKNSELFRFITWNINMQICHSQFQSIIKSILKEQPDVILLQEVTNTPLKFLKIELEPKGYTIIKGKQIDYYFTITAVKNETTKIKNVQVIDFPKSKMSRYLLITEIECQNRKLHLINAHLESTRQFTNERKRQLLKTLKIIQMLDEISPVIFAGDTNLRDSELSEIGGLPEGIYDAWEVLGRPANCKFTWSTERMEKTWPFKHSRLRFDRIFFKPQGQIIPEAISPIGKNKMTSGQYPSDHIGLLVSFKIR